MNNLRTVTLNVIIVVNNVIISLVVSIAKSTAFTKAIFSSIIFARIGFTITSFCYVERTSCDVTIFCMTHQLCNKLIPLLIIPET